MSELGVRLVVVGGAAVLTVLLGLALRSGRWGRRRPVSLPGLATGVTLLSSSGCGSCDRLRATLEDLGVEFVEVDAGDPRFPTTIDRVPTLVVLDENGAGWALAGVPDRRRIAGLLSGP